MGFDSNQVEQIQREIDELKVLDLETLTASQKEGHYERSVELLEETISQQNKELSLALLSLAQTFNPKGMDLNKLENQVGAIQDRQIEESSDDGPAIEAAGARTLKRSIDDVRASSPKKAGIKIILKIVLGENDIDFDKKDSAKVMQERIDTWLADTGIKAEEETDTPPERAVQADPMIDKANELSNELLTLVDKISTERRAQGKDIIRFNKFNRELRRSAQRRLVG